MNKILLTSLVVLFVSILNKAWAQLPPGLGTTDSCDIGGLYYIGPNGYYASLTEALDSLGKRGIGADIILELNAAYNSSVEVFPIKFPKTNRIKCYSYVDNYTVTIRPASNALNATITGSNTTAIFNLDSCRYVRIDGRPGGIDTIHLLTINNNTDAPAIALFNASNNIIQYTNLSGGIAGTGLYTGILHVQGTKGTGCDNNKFYKCNLYSNATLPNAKAILMYSKNALGFQNNNDSIIGCSFFNFNKSAIQLDNYAEAWVIKNNSFYSTASINYNNEVAAIKINTTTVIQHVIDNNFFGGTQPMCKGNSMLINYKIKFYWIDVAGSTSITNNQFARQNFVNTVNNAGQIDVRMINAADENNASNIYIANNNIGSVQAADSLHFTQSFDNTYTTVAGIVVNIGNEYKVFNNTINYLHCYAPNNGAIALMPIYTFNGYANISGNIVGSPALYNSIINNTDAATYGIACLGATTKINNNVVSRITSTSTTSSAAVLGIYVNSGSIDSVCSNTIFQLKNAISANSFYAPLGGMSITPSTVGGLGNIVSDNTIHSLQNYSTLQGGSVVGMHLGSHLMVKRNFIHSLNSTDQFNTTIYGILIPDKFSELENNMVSLGIDSTGNSISAGNLSFIGISGGHTMRHNTVYIGGSNVQDGFLGSMCYAFLGNALPTYCYNNIFYNARSNALISNTSKHQCVNMDLSYGSNNNLFYYDGIGGIAGTYQANRYITLDNYKAGSGLEANSIFTNPNLVAPAASYTSINLHLNYGSPADGAGDANYTVNDDYDKAYRNSLTPVDIGADAGNYANCPFANAGNDVSFFEGGSTQLGVTNAIANASYIWSSSPVGFTSILANPIVSPTVSTLYRLTLSVGNCVSSDSVHVTVFPALINAICANQTINISANNTAGNTFQWQVNTGAGYANINNSAAYAGTNTAILTIYNTPSAFYNYKYRCLVNNLSDVVRQLKFKNEWTGTSNNLWNNAANWSCGIVPDGNTDVLIETGTVLLNTNGVCRSIYVAPNATCTVGTGFILTVTH